MLLSCCPSGGTERNVKLSRTHYLLGADYLKKKMANAAKRELLKSIELDAANKDANQLLGVIFFMEGLEKVNLLERENCLTGKAALEQRREANKEFRRSKKYLQAAVDLARKQNKTESDGLNYLANVALHLKRYDEAIALAKKALDNILYGSRHLALGTLGWALYRKGDLDGAARELRQAVFHEPRFCIGRYRLAKVYYKQKRLDAARTELEKVVADKACPIQEAYQLLGLVQMKQNKLDEARKSFTTCVKIKPTSCVSKECQRYAKLM